MDFWDITKLLVRRWMIVLPMLALSGGLAVAAMSQVSPDYVATAYVQLVPPVTGETKPGQPTADQRNPWIRLGLQTIGNAAIVTVTDLSFAEDLQARGYSSSYTATMAQSSPLVTFEIVGSSPDQAKQTAEQLINRFDKSVADLQTSYGVSTADSITGRRLDVGTNVKESTSKVKRALVAVAGAGLLLTVATTVGVDAWLRRRQRRLAGAEPAAAAVPSVAVASPWVPQVAHSNGDHRSGPYLVPKMGPANGHPPAGVGRVGERPGVRASTDADRTEPVRQHGPVPVSPAPEERDADRTMAIPSDATIVLPRVRPSPAPRAGQGE